MTEEEKQQMVTGLKAVRELLGEESTAVVSDKDIEESLWYYYFDVARTVDYVLSEYWIRGSLEWGLMATRYTYECEREEGEEGEEEER